MFNNGYNSATNVKMDISVTRNGESYYTGTSENEYPIASLSFLAVDTAELFGNVDSPLYAQCLGDYQVDFNIGMDATDEYPLNNVDSRTFSVTENTYARDNGTVTSTIGPGSWSGNGADGDRFGVRYAINDDSQANTIAKSGLLRNPATSRHDSWLNHQGKIPP